MATILTVSASPSAVSKTAHTRRLIDEHLAGLGHTVHALDARELPPAALLSADTTHPAIAAAVELFDRADGVVVATPVYKASYSGLLKTLLDLLPQRALADKVVLPLATGGTQGHLVAIDYALRPLLTSMGADRLVPGCFVLDRLIQYGEEGGAIAPDARAAVDSALEGFDEALGSTSGRLAAAS